jgi:uncharacterized phage protein (predicted DNA packaging)
VSNLLTEIKRDLRITNDGFDGEVQDLINGAKQDLILSGVLQAKVVDTDPLIKRAVSLYAKAHFGLDNADSEKYMAAFTSLKTHLTLSSEYTVVS